METTDKTIKIDEQKTRQLIMVLVCNRIRKNNEPKKYGDMLKATLKAIPMTVLMDFATVVDSFPFFDVDRLYGPIIRPYSPMPNSEAKVSAKIATPC